MSGSLRGTLQLAPRVKGSGVQQVYERLKASILELALDPGAPLDEVTLAEAFGMSRTPVREALVRLAAEGLVSQLPNRNTIVAPIDFGALPVYFEALTLMYRVTTRLAAGARTGAHLDAMRRHQAAYARAVHENDVPGMIGHNRDLHATIAEAGGNPYFTALFARLLDEGRRTCRAVTSTSTMPSSLPSRPRTPSCAIAWPPSMPDRSSRRSSAISR